MACVVTEPCVNCKYTDCVVVCPCECFYGDEKQLYVDPVDCIDCEACIPECPVSAIFIDRDVPPQWENYIELNADRTRELKLIGGPITEKVPRAGSD